MPTLTIQLPGLPPVEHILREEAVTLGRMKGNTIALDDSSVSLSHAKITRLGNDYFLKDLNSTNGTMLNGQSINEARLRDGDQLKFGEVMAVFRLEPLFASVTVPAGSPPAPVPPPQPAAQTVAGPLAIVAAPAPLPAPVPVPAYKPAAPTATRPVSPAPTPVATPPRAPGKNVIHLLVPVLGGISAVGVIGFIIWQIISHGAGQTESVSPPSPPPKPTLAAKPGSPAAPGKPRTKPVNTRPPTPLPKAVQPEPVAPQPGNPALDALIADLKSLDVTTRRTAAQAISAIETGAKAAVPSLRVALGDADADVRMWSALALVNNQAYDKATIPVLIQILKHDSPTLRQVACISLALIPYDQADKAAVVPALKTLAATDASPEVRTDALTALKVIAPEDARGQ